MNSFTVAEYESGWYVETAADGNPERLIQCSGPYENEWAAQKCADEMNMECLRNAH